MKQKHNKRIFFVLLFGILLFTWGMRSQSTSGVAINWDKEVGCQLYSEDGKDRKDPIFLEDIRDGICIRVCEKSIVTYTLTGNLGPAPNTTWTVSGGTILSSSNNICIVNWGTVGNASLNFVLTTPNGVVEKSICMEKIAIPKASFTVNNVLGAVLDPEVIVLPLEKPKDIYACVGQMINFENTSTVATDIVSYFWDFGDGTYSTAYEPSHTYNHDDSFTVILTVYNSCNCSSSYKKTVHIKGDGGFEILCPGVVCEGETVTYSLPFEGQDICHDSYVWNAAGASHQPIVDPHNGNATVTWDQVGNDGFALLTFVPTDCELACLLPTTIKIPVIKQHGTIYGDAAICMDSQSIYSLPQWPSTDFHWSILGDPNESAVDIILSDQRNQVILSPHEPGTFTLFATYENTLLHCGGTATFVVTVSPTTHFSGPTLICQNATASYHTDSGLPTTWVLRKSTGQVVATTNPNPGTSFVYTFNTPGNYSISVGASGTCPAQQKEITVVAIPPAVPLSTVMVLDPDNINPGTFVAAATLEVCPNAPYTYKVPNSPTKVYRWSVTHGSIEGAVAGIATGNEVLITFDGTAPPVISITSDNITPLPCSSPALNIPVPLKQINARINNGTQEMVCANTDHNVYTAKNTVNPFGDYTEGDTYAWSILPNTLGSITSGQGTKSIEVIWNNTAIQVTATLSLTITKCSISKTITIPVVIKPVPQIAITASPSTVCSGDPITFLITDTNGVPITAASGANWNFGYGETAGAIGETYTYTNITSSGADIGHDVTVYVTNPNGCLGMTNTATVHVVVHPGPPATASLSSNANAFCDPATIDATLTIATGMEPGITYQWYKNSDTNPIPGATGAVLYVTPSLGFGSYYFIATNSQNCHTKSNFISVMQFCSSGPACTLNPSPAITNTASFGCLANSGVINLTGSLSTSPVPLDSYWDIGGPNESVANYQAATFTPHYAGEYHTFHIEAYDDGNGGICRYASDKIILVPYIPDLGFNKVCNGNNNFTVTLLDKTNFFALITSPTVTYQYRLLPSGSWVPLPGNLMSGLLAGNYEIKVTVNGVYNGTAQPTCERVFTLNLATIPNQSITANPTPVSCYDTAVGFAVPLYSLTDNFLWTFEPSVTNTLATPSRVFSTPDSTYNVAVTISNTSNCALTLNKSVYVPKKCFNGTIVSAPADAKACSGTGIVLSYLPDPTIAECTPLTYTWMRGQNPIGGNTSTITVNTPGFYWVNIKRNDCKYDVPNRITPTFYPAPTLKLVGPSTVCENGNAVVDATSNASQFNWSVVHNGITTAHPEFHNLSYMILSGLGAGNYTILATVISDKGCTTTAAHTITISAAPAVPIISQAVVCPGVDSSMPYYHITLSATSDVSGVFNWSNGVSGATQTVTDGGPYQVRVTANGCSSTSQVDVPKSPENFMWIFPSGCQTTCASEGQNVLIGPRLPVEMWAWLHNEEVVSSGTGFTEPLNLTGNGSYNLMVNNGVCTFMSNPLDYTAQACEKCDIKSVKVDYIHRREDKFCSFDVGLQIDSNVSGSFALTAPNNDVIISPTAVSVAAGAFTYPFVIIPVGSNFAGGVIHLVLSATSDEKPCYTDFTFELPACDGSTGSENKVAASAKPYRITLTPNPAKSSVMLQYEGVDSATDVSLYDLSGRALAAFRTETATGELLIATDKYPPGIYLVVVRSEHGLLSQQKLVIE
ncbi:MAG: hypothetical protein RL427_1548 [Bacteroidota bacterium]